MSLDISFIGILIGSIMASSVPLILAASGELITERSGVLNLGVEGMMIIGAISGFALMVITDNLFIAIIGSMLSGVIISLIFGFLTQSLLTNHVATGLALTIFGIGLSSMLGKEYIGTPIDGLSPWFFVIFSFAIVFIISYFFYKTKAGLILRAVGESHNSAHALGYSVIKIRFLSILFGGSMCALAGSYISICYAPMWQEGMTAGRGWIALALVVFATWKPERVLIGAYIFGVVTILQMNLQALGLRFPGQFFSMAPYLATIVVLVLISNNKLRIKLSAPASLTIPFYKGR